MNSNITWFEMINQPERQLTPAEISKIVCGMEELCKLTTEELYNEYWDAYKSFEGIRPRWTDPTDREGMLCWFARELIPSVAEERAYQFQQEELYYAEQERKLAKEEAEYAAQQIAEEELAAAYDARFDKYDPRLYGYQY